MTHENTLPIWRVDNVYTMFFTLIGGVFAFAALYFSATGDIREIRKDIAFIKEQNQAILDRYVSLEDRYGKLALQVNTLEVRFK